VSEVPPRDWLPYPAPLPVVGGQEALMNALIENRRVIGIDLHRRRSVMVRPAADGQQIVTTPHEGVGLIDTATAALDET
jgi:hypothetical protein